jgi:16S rRNA (uracil1498-N3)-methyltransferase
MHKSETDLTYPGGKLRLFVEARLAPGAIIGLSEGQSHYLRHVMRASTGDNVLLFNGQDGEWRAEITLAGKKGVEARPVSHVRQQAVEPDLWLLFAPVKRAPIDFLVEKATELGASLLQPVFTRRTIVTRVNLDRLKAHAVEAAEQSDRLSVPVLKEPITLDRVFEQWDATRQVLYCDESGEGPPAADVLRDAPKADRWAVLTGPEGGFDLSERERLRSLKFARPASLGPRILRADTAALAALAIWQSVLGDWR